MIKKHLVTNMFKIESFCNVHLTKIVQNYSPNLSLFITKYVHKTQTLHQIHRDQLTSETLERGLNQGAPKAREGKRPFN